MFSLSLLVNLMNPHCVKKKSVDILQTFKFSIAHIYNIRLEFNLYSLLFFFSCICIYCIKHLALNNDLKKV